MPMAAIVSRSSSNISADDGYLTAQNDFFLRQVETTVSKVLDDGDSTKATDPQDVKDLPVEQREAVSIAKEDIVDAISNARALGAGQRIIV